MMADWSLARHHGAGHAFVAVAAVAMMVLLGLVFVPPALANDGGAIADDAKASTVPTVSDGAQAGDFVMSGGREGESADYHFMTDVSDDATSTGTLMIHPQSADMTLTVSMAGTLRHPSAADSTATKDRIVVASVDGVPANVVLDGVRINLSGDAGIDAAAFSHTSGKLNLTLARNSENRLISGPDHAGLEKNDLQSGPSEAFALTISSQGSTEADWGSLLAQSYDADSVLGAGIGGGRGKSGSYITISGGTVTAQSYSKNRVAAGAGIGGGSNGTGSYITISGGTVTAQSYSSGASYGAEGAGIGGGAGSGGNGEHISITGGTVTAQSYSETSESNGAGIGGGYNGNGSYITISGGLVTAQSYSKDGEVYGAGIGGGGYWGNGSDIVISGGTVVAQAYSVNSGVGGAGIGGGYNGNGSDITISGGKVTAQSYSESPSFAFGAGIGGGHTGYGSNVVITGGSVKVVDGTGRASSTTPQPTDGEGHNVYLAVVPASADHRTVRSCAASGDCSDASGAWKTDWKIDGTHVNADGSVDANLYLWLPVSDGAASDQFVQTSSADSSYTPYRLVYTGKNAEGATNPWQWFATAASSTYMLSIPKTTVSMDEDTASGSATVTVTNVKLVDPNKKLSISGSVVGGAPGDWTASDGLKLTRSDGNATLRSIVTDGDGTQLGSESPLLGNIGDGDSTVTLRFAKPTVEGDSKAVIPAGQYSANLTFAITESRQ